MSDNHVESVSTDDTKPVTVNIENVAAAPVNPITENDCKISCWVCFANAEDDQNAEWVQPCRCRGTTKWVHQSCLQRWIDEKQKGNTSAKVSCPQCNAEYVLVFPPFGPLVHLLDFADRMMYKVCPLATAGIVVGSIYWTAVTYGAVTVMQILGQKEGLSTMEQTDPLVLLIGLPTIPVMLILGKMLRWEDYLLKLWRRYWNRIPGLKMFLGGSLSSGERSLLQTDGSTHDLPSFSDPVSASRVLCGALLLPTMATVFGRVFFNHISYNPHKTLLGGITFIAMKGVFKMYLRQQQYVRQCQRKILNYDKNSVFPHPMVSGSGLNTSTSSSSSSSSSTNMSSSTDLETSSSRQ